jgi:hypothetical protein
MQNEGVEHEDVAMKLLATSLTKYSKRWFDGLRDNHLTIYEVFAKLFKSRWSLKKDSRMLMTQFKHIKKKGERDN